MDEEVEPVRIEREVFILCALAPWVFTPLMMPQVYELELVPMLRKIAAVYVPFIATPALIALAFHRLAPPLIRRTPSWVGRFAIYLALSSASSLLASALTLPLCEWILGADMPGAYHVVHGLIITWVFALPTVAVQEQRSRANRNEQRAQRERQAALEAQLAALSARTHPHFFFNSINTVASLIPDDPQKAEETLIRIADILRYALDSGRERFVALARELAIVQDYLEVQKARFESKLRFGIEAAPDLSSIAVPPLFLQPLVENAVLHGVSQRSSGGEVRVSVRRDRDLARIEVRDDGVGPGGSQHRGSGTALRDLATRLRLLYGDEGRLESGATPTGGYRVEVTLPARELASLSAPDAEPSRAAPGAREAGA